MKPKDPEWIIIIIIPIKNELTKIYNFRYGINKIDHSFMCLCNVQAVSSFATFVQHESNVLKKLKYEQVNYIVYQPLASYFTP